MESEQWGLYEWEVVLEPGLVEGLQLVVDSFVLAAAAAQ